jgi:hypothetical protein
MESAPGAIWDETASRSRKIREAGQPAPRIVGDTEGRKAGATRISVCRHRRKMREPGRLGTPSPAKPDASEQGATHVSERQALQGGVRNRGNLAYHANRQRLRHARFGDTRNSIAGTANGLKLRGNLQLRRRRGKRALKTGQPEDAWRTKADASGSGGTRSLIDRPKGR